jgi:hypothetical protein
LGPTNGWLAWRRRFFAASPIGNPGVFLLQTYNGRLAFGDGSLQALRLVRHFAPTLRNTAQANLRLIAELAVHLHRDASLSLGAQPLNLGLTRAGLMGSVFQISRQGSSHGHQAMGFRMQDQLPIMHVAGLLLKKKLNYLAMNMEFLVFSVLIKLQKNKKKVSACANHKLPQQNANAYNLLLCSKAVVFYGFFMRENINHSSIVCLRKHHYPLINQNT